ncbi:MAG: Gfo/Idh/MocA family oxidoreductase [Kiritimatiellae bacterium]|nr:Gfo/Idh/MocA family oxidoreductase [Kiritimatiellia bacterium]
MEMDRREFLKGTAWMGVAAMAAGCISRMPSLSGRASMFGFAVAPIKKLRVGIVGLGQRGPGAVHRMASIPGNEVVALCDRHADRVKRQNAWLKENGHPEAREYTGEEGWKDMCQSDLDLVYVVTPWHLHAKIGLYAMEHGKHTVIEVPSAMTVEECHALVETAERTQRHCMQLENCCYGEIEMLTLNLVRNGILGELKHVEGAYIHDLRDWCYMPPEKGGYDDYWRLHWNAKHVGDQYITHGLVPIMQYMNINRGDKLDYLVSLESQAVGFNAYADAVYPEGSWQRSYPIKMGDMNTTLIKTHNGRSIMIQHDVSSPRPYSRINLVSGTQGMLCDYPYRLALADKPGGGAHAFDEVKAEEIRRQYKHPLWKKAGEFAKAVGGHGGMDFLMDLRLSYCLQNGQPLDMNVYDLATSCCLQELSERSVKNRSASIDIPDFTRGAWQSAEPLGIVDVDLDKMGININEGPKADASALNV